MMQFFNFFCNLASGVTLLHEYDVSQCRVGSLAGNVKQEIVVETKDGNVECEAKLLDLRVETRTRNRATKRLKGSRMVGSRKHQRYLQLVNSPAFWACRNVDHFFLALLATTWAKQTCLRQTVK